MLRPVQYSYVARMPTCADLLLPVAREHKLIHIGGAKKFPIHLWEITTTDLQQWQQVVATTRVLNMIFTKKPELVLPAQPQSEAAARPKCNGAKTLGPVPGGVRVPDAPTSAKPGVTGSRWYSQCQDAGSLAGTSYPTHVHSAVEPSFEFDIVETVMETTPGTCDVFSGDFCCGLSAGTNEITTVDAAILATIKGFLHACTEQTPDGCDALDIGANMGTMSKYMLSTGARVRAIEPQTDLAALVWATACRNGWGEKMTMYNNAVTADPAEAGSVLELGNQAEGAANWGFRPDGSHHKKGAQKFQATKIYVGDVIVGTPRFSLIKIDTDAIDHLLLLRFIELVCRRIALRCAVPRHLIGTLLVPHAGDGC